MNRRDFLETIAAATVGAALVPNSLEARRAQNPKIYLFGFIAINRSDGLQAVFPSHNGMVQHRPFVAGTTSAVSDLIKSGSKAIDGSGIHEAHYDFSYLRWPWGACLSNKTITAGSGSATVDAGLESRLPKLRDLGKAVDGKDRNLNRADSFSVTLRGGTLRMPGQKSRCPGVAAGIKWQFKYGATNLLAPTEVTDMAVFESSSSTMVVARDGEDVTLGMGEVLWLFNLPLLHPNHDSTQVIEHVGDWFALLDKPFPTSDMFTAVTASPVSKIPRISDFIHPCIQGAEDLERAVRYMQERHQRFVLNRRLAPPDSDPCIIVEI